MRKLLLPLLLAATCAASLNAGEEKVTRDSNGQLVSRTRDTAAGQTVRDSNGRIVERRTDVHGTSARGSGRGSRCENTSATRSVIRDRDGKPTGSEAKK